MSLNPVEDISYENIYNLLSPHIKAEHAALWKRFKEERFFKRLIRHGEKQFFDAPNETSFEDESRKAKMNFAEINLLALDLDKDINKIIQEKLEGGYHNKFKQEVLNALLILTSKQKQIKASPTKSGINSETIEERVMLEKIKDLSQFCAESINDIRKQVQEMPDEEAEYSAVDMMDDLVIKTEFEEMEPDETEDDLNQTEELMNINNNQQIKKDKGGSPETESEVPENDMSSASHKPQRTRKPNMKYITDNIGSPSKRKSFELDVESITSASTPVTQRETLTTTDRETPRTVDDKTPRRRGRPRKHPA